VSKETLGKDPLYRVSKKTLGKPKRVFAECFFFRRVFLFRHLAKRVFAECPKNYTRQSKKTLVKDLFSGSDLTTATTSRYGLMVSPFFYAALLHPSYAEAFIPAR
jgi:hypothetical protein